MARTAVHRRSWVVVTAYALSLVACNNGTRTPDGSDGQPGSNTASGSSEAKGSKGGPRVQDSSSRDGMSREARYELYKQKFRKARADPRLIRGRMIPHAEVKCKTMQIWDYQANRALILRALSPDGGHFMFYLGDNIMVGQVEPLWSQEERIFLLSGLRVGRGSFEGDQLQPMADLIETLQNNCTAGRTRHIPSFVLLEKTEVWPKEMSTRPWH